MDIANFYKTLLTRSCKHNVTNPLSLLLSDPKHVIHVQTITPYVMQWHTGLKSVVTSIFPQTPGRVYIDSLSAMTSTHPCTTDMDRKITGMTAQQETALVVIQCQTNK